MMGLVAIQKTISPKRDPRCYFWIDFQVQAKLELVEYSSPLTELSSSLGLNLPKPAAKRAVLLVFKPLGLPYYPALGLITHLGCLSVFNEYDNRHKELITVLFIVIEIPPSL